MSERTPQEREAARREREARRSGQPDEPAVPPPLTAAARSPERPASGESVPPAGPSAPDRSPLLPLPVDPPAAVGQAGAAGHPAAPERPAARLTPRTGRAARPVGGGRGPRRTRRIVARVFAVGALVLTIAAIWFLVELFQPFHGSGHGTLVVTVPAGLTARKIGDQLAHDGVVSSGFFFDMRAMLAGERGKLRAGTFRLKRGMSYAAVLAVLTTPPKPAKVTNVTVIPGRTRRQIATLLRKQGVRGSYLADTRTTKRLNLRSYGAPRKLDTLEGFLFPSTYQLREPISIRSLVADQLTTFRQQFATVSMGYARSKHLSPYDVLIIASMVEAEAGTAHDRPLIASVIYNRLRDGMPLGIDATVRYAVNNYTSPLTQSQLDSPSPYNTRTHTGLTPTPIDNPSLSSIEAAAHPARTSYLYFVAKPCGNGASAFASTLAQFNTDVQRYNAARAKRGGRSPLVC